jgi:linoleoyl-CoA desaturase
VQGDAQLVRFRRLLRKRVSLHFSGLSTGIKGNRTLHFKLTLALAAYAGSLFLVMAKHEYTAGLLASYSLFGLAQAYMLLNVGHDSSHDALSHHRHVNRALRLSLDMCGIDSELFAMSHVQLHHHRVNIGREDEAIRARGMLRLSPHMQRPIWGAIQHWLVWPIYSLGTLDFIFLRDWEMIRLRPRALARLIVGKALYLGITLVSPLWLSQFDPAVVVCGWILAQMITGLLVMTMLQITHLVEEAQFPREIQGSALAPRHVMATTIDVAIESRILAFAAGGLHQHVAHHLFPGMCHVHYSTVTRLIEQTAIECGLPYRRHRRLKDAVSAHLQLLRRLGRTESGSPAGPDTGR